MKPDNLTIARRSFARRTNLVGAVAVTPNAFDLRGKMGLDYNQRREEGITNIMMRLGIRDDFVPAGRPTSQESAFAALAAIVGPDLARGATLSRKRSRGRMTLFVSGRHPIINVELRPFSSALKAAFKVEEVRIG